MAISATGPITASDIMAAFPGGSKPFKLSNYYRGKGLVPDVPQNSAIPTSGDIAFSDFRGAVNTSSGTKRYGPGEYLFDVPVYTTMTARVVGPGGGAGESCWDASSVVGSGVPGFPGTAGSSFGDLYAGPGEGGGGCVGGGKYHGNTPPKAAAGAAGNGHLNTPGGGAKGGKGLPCFACFSSTTGGEGGDGGLVESTWTIGDPTIPNVRMGAPIPGSKLRVVVGAGGQPGHQIGQIGAPGEDGYVEITWS